MPGPPSCGFATTASVSARTLRETEREALQKTTGVLPLRKRSPLNWIVVSLVPSLLGVLGPDGISKAYAAPRLLSPILVLPHYHPAYRVVSTTTNLVKLCRDHSLCTSSPSDHRLAASDQGLFNHPPFCPTPELQELDTDEILLVEEGNRSSRPERSSSRRLFSLPVSQPDSGTLYSLQIDFPSFHLLRNVN